MAVVHTYKTLVVPAVTVGDKLTAVDIATLEVEKKVFITDSNSLVQLSYWKNKAGQLILECESKQKKVDWTETNKTITKVVVQEVEKKITPWWWYVITTVLVIIIILLIIIKIIR
jgi:hypothetical protein